MDGRTNSSPDASGAGDVVPSGVPGLDQVLGGGLGRGRVAVVRGGSGCGKTIMSLMVALVGDSHGIFCTLDEPPDRIRQYARALTEGGGLTVLDLRRDLDVSVSGGGIELAALIARLELALEESNGTRVVIDSLDQLLDHFSDVETIQRGVLQLFGWARERNVILLCTAGEYSVLPDSVQIVDYAADTIMRLSQDLQGGIMTRNLWVQKNRGRAHVSSLVPFLIDEGGATVSAASATRLAAPPPGERVSTGVDGLDEMLGGGYRTGTSMMISGRSGAGKSLLAQTLAAAACARSARVLLFSFEESPAYIVEHAASVGLDLHGHLEAGRLRIISRRVVERSLVEHLITIVRELDDWLPDLLIVDPITALTDISDGRAYKNVAIKLSSITRDAGMTAVFTELGKDGDRGDEHAFISSLVDTWIQLDLRELDGELLRLIQVRKSRGSASSPRILEFVIANTGVVVEAPFVSDGHVVYGAAKAQVLVHDEQALGLKKTAVANLREEIEAREGAIEARARDEALRAEMEVEDLRRRLVSAERDLSAHLQARRLNDSIRPKRSSDP